MTLDDFNLSLNYYGPTYKQGVENFKATQETLNTLVKTFISYYGPLILGGGKDPKVGKLYELLQSSIQKEMTLPYNVKGPNIQSGGMRNPFARNKNKNANSGANLPMQPPMPMPMQPPMPMSSGMTLVEMVIAIEQKINQGDTHYVSP